MRILIFLLISFMCAIPALADEDYEIPRRYRTGITVTHSNAMAPLSFLGVNGEPKGFVVDFWKKWAKDTGVPVTFKLVNWKEGLEQVKNGESDVHGSLYKTIARQEYLDYVSETFPVKSILFVKKSSDIHKLEDLGNAPVGVLDKGSSIELILNRVPNANTRVYPDTKAEVAGLVNGEVEAIVMDAHVFHYLVGQIGAGHDVEGREVIYQNHLYPAVAKGNKELLELLEWGMSLVSSREREDIVRRWYIADSETSQGLKIAVGASVVGFLVALAWFFFGGRSRRSRE